jgi:hypothetical protein
MLRVPAIELVAGEVNDIGTKTFAPVCRVTGKFTGLVDGALPSTAQFHIGQASGEYASFEITGASFKSSPLAPGTHHLSLRVDRFVPIYRTVELEPGENLELTLDLVPAGIHIVRIRTADGDPTPSWIGGYARSDESGLSWSGALTKQEDGSFVAKVSALPGTYTFEGTSDDGRKATTQFQVRHMDGEPEESTIELNRIGG